MRIHSVYERWKESKLSTAELSNAIFTAVVFLTEISVLFYCLYWGFIIHLLSYTTETKWQALIKYSIDLLLLQHTKKNRTKKKIIWHFHQLTQIFGIQVLDSLFFSTIQMLHQIHIYSCIELLLSDKIWQRNSIV